VHTGIKGDKCTLLAATLLRWLLYLPKTATDYEPAHETTAHLLISISIGRGRNHATVS
jgi:hypothetical protein